MRKIEESILLIEKNAFISGILSQRLTKEGFPVITVNEGQEGLEIITKKRPSLVVIDLPLADISIFFGVLRNLVREEGFEQPPVIVLSDVESEQEIEKVSKLGATSYLVKSYTDTDEIIKNIKDILKRKGKTERHAMGIDNTDLPEIKPASKEEIEAKKDERSRESESAKKKSKEPMIGRAKRLKGDIEKITFIAEKNEEDESAIIDLIDRIVEYGFWEDVSDIHFKPEKEKLMVRMRVDGVLRDVFTLPKSIQAEITTRVKVLAGMRTDEHQAAQDGRFHTDIKSMPQQFDVRVSVVPTYYGEDAVLRLLVEKTQIENLKDIPFSKADRKRIERAITKPYGMILATGPTGSGKTTTLYTILKRLNTKDVSIITIEDPIEYSLDGINQIQVNARTELTFANGLRAILRQDPDIIMVGEIRDKETAGIAVNAALTGHKLLSTLHTNDAPTTLPRLLDMNVEPFLIASTINIAIGQRLVRMLCNKCKVKKTLTPAEKKHLIETLPTTEISKYTTFYTAKGCDECSVGYKGRLGIYEVLEVDDEIREAIVKRENASTIKKIAIKNGMTTMVSDGLEKAAQGLTSVEEIIRAAQE
ncbi:MAG: ATPase, T2SS/T4P/T4SS family [Parcubacteria group bacterium]